jgi:hypothetical protein
VGCSPPGQTGKLPQFRRASAAKACSPGPRSCFEGRYQPYPPPSSPAHSWICQVLLKPREHTEELLHRSCFAFPGRWYGPSQEVEGAALSTHGNSLDDGKKAHHQESPCLRSGVPFSIDGDCNPGGESGSAGCFREEEDVLQHEGPHTPEGDQRAPANHQGAFLMLTTLG